MNLFFVSTFPLTALSAVYVFRRFGLAAWPALAGSLLYTFLPFHYSRGQHHLFLAAYYLVPLAVMVALWLASGTLGVVDPRERRWAWRWCRPRLVASALICGLLASSGTYYAFFACFFFLVAGALAAVRRRDARWLALPVALAGLTLAVLTVNFGPSILYLQEHGGTPLVRRDPADAELYGLRISQLLLPATGHRLSSLAAFKDVVNVRLVTNESDDASLGLVVSLGFLALLACLALPATGALRDLSLLNLSALLLATMGGFGALVALTITSQIRAYTRISIFIAFFSVFALVLGLDALDRRCRRSRARRAAFVLGLAALVTLAVLDQTPARAVPRYEGIAAAYRSDAAFVRALEAVLPRDALVFQLPVVPFPEHPPVHRMHDYDHARAYLHGRQLRWSYGAMKGRADAVWQAWIAAKPVDELLDTLAAAGFSGLYLDRAGYADGGTRIEAEIARVLGRSPLASDDRRLRFFDLTAHRDALRAAHSAEAWEARRQAALHPLLLVWDDGCSDLEGTPQDSFRWCAAAGAWRLVNGSRDAKRVTLDMSFMALYPGTLRLEGLVSHERRVGLVPEAFSTTITVPPGEHTIRFACDARRVLASGDRRHLVFRVRNFRALETPRD
jgi:phosphoglycerol transferase